MREMTKAVDTVRKQEHRAFLRAGEGSPLTGTKYLWLFSDERRPARHAAVTRFFTRWYGWAIRSRLAPVKQVAKTLKRHLAPLCPASDHEWRG